MVTYTCVEPASQSEVAKNVVWATAVDDIVFPGVDSCLAIGIVLADGNMIGGHVATLNDAYEDTPTANKNRTAGLMNGLRGPQAVDVLVTLGDTNWTAQGLKAVFGANRHIRYSKGAGSYYLMMDGSSGRIVVQRGFNGVPIGPGETFAGNGDKHIQL